MDVFFPVSLALSRVHDTLLHIDAIVNRSNCLNGVHKSLQTEDFKSIASYIQTFLQTDSKFKDSSAADQREQLLSLKKQFEGVIKKRLSTVVDQRDCPTILRFIKLFMPLDLEERGLQVYVSYLKKVISSRSRMEFEQLVELMEQSDNDSRVNFVACLTNLVKDIVMAIEENNEILRNLCGKDDIVYAICELQEECDSRGSNILKKFMEYKKLSKLISEINSYQRNLKFGIRKYAWLFEKMDEDWEVTQA